MDSSLRFLAPLEHDRVNELFKKYNCVYPNNIKTQIQLLKILKISSKYIELLDKIELFILKNHEFNFMLRNLPEFAQLREDNKTTSVGYTETMDTLIQFGNVNKLEIIKGTVYAKFDNPEYCHKTINNMQIGKNIISTKIIC